MKKTSGVPLRIWSLFMILAGAVCIVLDVMLTLSRFHEPGNSRFAVFAGAILLLVCGILEISAGIKAFLLLNASYRGSRLRAPGKKLISLKRLSAVTILLCLVEIILSCVIGISFDQLAAMAVAGILIPLLYLLIVRSLQA